MRESHLYGRPRLSQDLSALELSAHGRLDSRGLLCIHSGAEYTSSLLAMINAVMCTCHLSRSYFSQTLMGMKGVPGAQGKYPWPLRSAPQWACMLRWHSCHASVAADKATTHPQACSRSGVPDAHCLIKAPTDLHHVTQLQGAGCMLSETPAPQLSAAHSTPTAALIQPT